MICLLLRSTKNCLCDDKTDIVLKKSDKCLVEYLFNWQTNEPGCIINYKKLIFLRQGRTAWGTIKLNNIDSVYSVPAFWMTCKYKWRCTYILETVTCICNYNQVTSLSSGQGVSAFEVKFCLFGGSVLTGICSHLTRLTGTFIVSYP